MDDIIEVEVSSGPFSAISIDTPLVIEVIPAVMGNTRFTDLVDFDDTNKNDQYVIMYDSATQTYKLVNPDKVLSSSATTELIQPGLPTEIIDTLDTDLDDKINLDAGNF
jgi:hypothetical protein